MRILFITDTHIRGTNPRSRVDNFYYSLKGKFNEIRLILEKEDIHYIFHGGDWFDRPDLSPSIVRDFAMIIKGFKCPIYTVAGNHDIYGHNPGTVSRTMLGLMEGIGLITLLTRDDEIILEKDGIKLQVTGSSYYYDIDKEGRDISYVIKKRKDVDYAVNLVHGMLVDKPFMHGIAHTIIKDIKHTQADVTLAGHYHSGFGIVEMDGKYFVNPGSIARLSNSPIEMSRTPKTVVLDFGDNISIKTIELSSALDGESVLTRSNTESLFERNLRLQYFCREISQTFETPKTNLDDIISSLISDDSIQDDVKEEVIKRISDARHGMK